MRKSRWVLLLFLAVVSAWLSAEELLLKDGTKITGKLAGISGDTFEVKTAYGEIKVPRSDVVSISFPENQPKNASGDATVPPVEESLTGTTYTNRTGSFQTTVPSGWLLAPEMRQAAEVVAALKSPDDTLFFLVTPEPFAGTLATYKVLAETQYKGKFSEYEKVSESEADVDGYHGIRFVFQGKPDKVTSMKCLVYMVPYEGRMVRLSFLTLEPLYNDAVPVFEKIVASYHSTGAAEPAKK